MQHGHVINQADREHLQSLTRMYASQPLATAIVGLLYVLFGATWLVGRPEFIRRHHTELLFPGLFLGMFVLPRLLRRFYYAPRFGHVKPRTPEISNREFWLVGIAGAIFFLYLMPFVILPGFERTAAWPLEPFSFFLGVLFVLLSIPELVRAPHNFAWRFLPFGFLLIVLSFLPVIHLQTKEQVSNGWIWVAFGVDMCVFGLHDHLGLLRQLSARDKEQFGG
jgi:hypothetical protein